MAIAHRPEKLRESLAEIADQRLGLLAGVHQYGNVKRFSDSRDAKHVSCDVVLLNDEVLW